MVLIFYLQAAYGLAKGKDAKNTFQAKPVAVSNFHALKSVRNSDWDRDVLASKGGVDG